MNFANATPFNIDRCFTGKKRGKHTNERKAVSFAGLFLVRGPKVVAFGLFYEEV